MLDFGNGVSALIFSSLRSPTGTRSSCSAAGRIVVPSAFFNDSDPLWVEVEDADGVRERIEIGGR